MASFDDFSKLDIRVGRIIEVEDLEGARKPIYKLKVDIGELGIKDIAAGIKDRYAKEELLNKLVVVVANLEPKSIAGFLSEGMLLAGEDGDILSLITPDRELRPGSRIG